MAHFCYYVPGRQVVSKGDLKKLHLEHALDGGLVSQRVTGPDEKPGVMLCGEGKTLPPVDSLKWIRPPTDDMGHPRTWWIGVPEEKPTPDELTRAFLLNGDLCTLGDGNQWLVPHVRRIDGLTEDGIRYACQLPTEWRIDDETGNPGNYVVEKYEALWAASKLAVELCIERPLIDRDPEHEVTHDFTMADAVGVTVLALSVNYRIGFWESLTLCLVTDIVIGDVMRALADRTAFSEWLDKNKEAAPVPPFPSNEEQDSPDGDSDLTPDTPQPEGSSTGSPASTMMNVDADA